MAENEIEDKMFEDIGKSVYDKLVDQLSTAIVKVKTAEAEVKAAQIRRDRNRDKIYQIRALISDYYNPHELGKKISDIIGVEE